MILTKVSSEVRTADAERLKNFRRAVTTSVQEAKPPRNYITEKQRGTLKNPNQGKSVVFQMADISIAVVLLDTDPDNAMTRFHCLSSVRVTRPTTSAKNYQKSFKGWVHVRSC